MKQWLATAFGLGVWAAGAATTVRGAVGQGYALSFQGVGSIAADAKGFFDMTDPGIDQLGTDFTIMNWLRWDKTTTGGNMHPVSLQHKGDTNFVQPFSAHGLYVNGESANWMEPAGDKWKQGTWQHMAFSVSAIDGGKSKYECFLDGELVLSATTGERINLKDFDSLSLKLGPNLYSGVDTQATAPMMSFFRGQLDEFKLFSSSMDEAQVAAHMNQGVLDPAEAVPDDLILYYSFDSVCTGTDELAAGAPLVPLLSENCAGMGGLRVPNLGKAGNDYDLLLGSTNDDFGFGKTFVDAAAGGDCPAQVPFAAPVTTMSTAPVTAGPGTPRVMVAPADGSTMSVPLDEMVSGSVTTATLLAHQGGGTVFADASETPMAINQSATASEVHFRGPADNFTQPVQLVFRLTEGSDTTVLQVHIWPALQPTSESMQMVETEDRSIRGSLHSFARSPSGNRIRARVVKLPQLGAMYNLVAGTKGSRIKAGELVEDYGGDFWYEPGPDESGIPYVDFEYVVVDNVTGIESVPYTVVIDVEPLDDLATADGAAYTVAEDAGAQLFELGFSDKENKAVTLAITKLPEHGKLFKSSNDRLDGTLTEISSPFEIFRVEPVTKQFVDDVVRVSSFWGKPPAAGYHAMQIIGSPHCAEYGECDDTRPAHAELGHLLEPLVGDVGKVKLPGNDFVNYCKIVDAQESEEEGGETLYTVRLIEMLKRVPDPDGGSGDTKLVACTMQGTSYPADCLTYTPEERESRLLFAGLSRTTLFPSDQGVWCPLNKAYLGDARITSTDAAVAYGDQYSFDHVQSELYTDAYPPATEFIEIKYKTAIYPVAIEIGSPRGMGQVVHVKAKDPNGAWQTLYTGEPDKVMSERHAAVRTYHRFSPSICRPSFLTSELRIEVDTSLETGIGDWNYIDYVALFGSHVLQESVLSFPNSKVVYVPNENYFGEDSFEFQAFDCGASRLRGSEEGHVSLTITPKDDLPAFVDTKEHIVPLNKEDLKSGRNMSIEVKVVEVDGDSVIITLESLPETGSLSFKGEPITTAPAVLFDQVLAAENGVFTFELDYKTPDCSTFEIFSSSFRLKVTDGTTTSSQDVPVSFECQVENQLDTLPITFGILGFGIVVVGVLGRNMQKDASVTLDLIDFLFSPLVTASTALSFEVADLITDVIACANLWQTDDRSLNTIKPVYLALVVIAMCVSLWGASHRITYVRYLLKRGIVQAKVMDGSIRSLHEKAVALLEEEVDDTHRSITAVKVTAVLLVAEDIPMIIANFVIIGIRREMLQENAFIVSVLLNFALLVIKCTVVARLRTLRRDLARLDITRQEIEANQGDMSKLVQAEALLAQRRANSTAVLKPKKSKQSMGGSRSRNNLVSAHSGVASGASSEAIEPNSA